MVLFIMLCEIPGYVAVKEREAAVGRHWGGRRLCLDWAESRRPFFLALRQESSEVNLMTKVI